MIRVLVMLIGWALLMTQTVLADTECPPAPEFQRGLSVVLYGNDTTMAVNTDAFFADLERRDLAVNSLILVFPLFMDSVYDTELYEDPELTPSLDNILLFAEAAKQHCYSLWLKPLIDDDRMGGWRGSIIPGGDLSDLTALDSWFASYGRLMLSYAAVAEQGQIEGLVVGTEMITLDKDLPKYNQRWAELISQVRAEFSGRVAYAMNWNPTTLPGLARARLLDVLMIDAFYDLAGLPDGATEEQIYQAWQYWAPTIQAYEAEIGLPIMFAEAGIVPRVGAYRSPWNGDSTRAVDFEAQRAYYAATCRFAAEEIDGIYWWAVGFYDHFQNQYQRYLDEGILTFNFYDLPAEGALRECYQLLETS